MIYILNADIRLSYRYLLLFNFVTKLRIISLFWLCEIQRHFDSHAVFMKVFRGNRIDNHRYGQLGGWRYCSTAVLYRGTACWEVAVHAEQDRG